MHETRKVRRYQIVFFQQNCINSFKSKTGLVVTDRKGHMGSRIEHLELYNKENTAFQEVLDSIHAIPITQELDPEPTTEIVENAIYDFASAKVPGNNAIPLKQSNKGNQLYFHTSMSLCNSYITCMLYC